MHECASVADDYISTIVKSFKNENAFFNILVDVFAAQLTRGQASDHLARSTYRVLDYGRSFFIYKFHKLYYFDIYNITTLMASPLYFKYKVFSFFKKNNRWFSVFCLATTKPPLLF